MLDEVASDADTAATPANASVPEKVQPVDAIFRLVPHKNIEKVTSDPDALSAPDAPEIKVQPGDTILRRGPANETERASTRPATSFFIRLLRSGARIAIVACLCGLAWAAGAYYSLGHSPFGLASRSVGAQQSPQRDDMVSAMRQMTEDMRALKASVGASNAGQKNQLNSAPATTGATVADLMGRVDKLDADFTTKLSQVNDRLASIEQQISASRAALASRAQLLRKRAKHLHDAFDPSKDPAAPGAPLPLGAR